MNGQDTRPYPTAKEIFKWHGVIIGCLYYICRFLAQFSLTFRWLRLASWSVIDGCTVDVQSGKPKPWWQDIGAILIAAAVGFAASLAWSQSYTAQEWSWYLALYLLFDILTFHVRLLWFDDLQPGIPPGRRRVWSYRRILFEAFINFAESIILFVILYRPYGEKSLGFFDLLHVSYGIATGLSRGDEARWVPRGLADFQVFVSLFFVAVVVSVIASVAFARKELAPEIPEV